MSPTYTDYIITHYLPPSQIRQLRVKEHGDAYRQKHGRESKKSAIHLQGKWLHDAGFTPGDDVRVIVEAGRIVITTL